MSKASSTLVTWWTSWAPSWLQLTPSKLTSLDELFWTWPAMLTLAGLIAALLMLVLRYSRSDDMPRLRLQRYAFPHDGCMRRPGQDIVFTARDKGTMKSASGCILRTYWQEPARSRYRRPRACLLYLPDWLDHMGHSALLARRFAEAGFAVHGFDFAGFGESEGARGVCAPFMVMVRDALDLAEDLKRRYQCPVFIGGHALGALIALACALTNPELFNGLVCFAPCIDITLRPWVHTPIRWIAKWLPGLRLTRWANTDQYSRNLCWQTALDEDPRFYKDRLPAYTWLQIIEAVQFANQHLVALRVPFHVMHGSKDLISVPKGSRTLYHSAVQLAPGAKTVLWYHVCWHGLLLEPEAEEVVQTCIQWVEDRLRCEQLARTLD